VCGLFACLVDSCWCKEDPNQVLHEGNTIISDEAGAVNAVKDFAFPEGAVPKGTEVKVLKMNPVFYNVFVNDASGNEQVYTIAADGTIIQTICGV